MFDPEVIGYAQILQQFWENHDPTQGMRQGNDHGTQYRSAIYTFDESQIEIAEATAESFGKRLAAAGYGAITTEIHPGFHCPALSHDASMFSRDIAATMALEQHGVRFLTPSTAVFAPSPGGRALLLLWARSRPLPARIRCESAAGSIGART